MSTRRHQRMRDETHLLHVNSHVSCTVGYVAIGVDRLTDGYILQPKPNTLARDFPVKIRVLSDLHLEFQDWNPPEAKPTSSSSRATSIPALAASSGRAGNFLSHRSSMSPATMSSMAGTSRRPSRICRRQDGDSALTCCMDAV